MTKQKTEVEAPFDPDAHGFFARAPMKRRDIVSAVRLVQRRIRWLEKQMAFEQSLTVQRNQFLNDAQGDLTAFEAELRAGGQWDYNGPTTRVAEHNLCKEMVSLSWKLCGNEHMGALAHALSDARSELERHVTTAQTWGSKKWDVVKEAEGV
jgi:hypothetical protein